MSKFILGVVITILVFVAYPKRVAIQCFILPDSQLCRPKPAPVAANSVESDIKKDEKPAKVQEIHKWVDDQGVVHFGEQSVKNSTRIDQDLREISVIENAADIKKVNSKASSTLYYTSQPSTSSRGGSSTQVNNIKRKKEKCSRLSANRNKYPLNSPNYKYWGSRYRQECLFD